MGENSTDALSEFMRQYMKQCFVKGRRIVCPGDADWYDVTAGGHKPNNDPKFTNPDQGGGSARDQ